MAAAASTALPPRSKIIAPAVAASGFPVTAIQCAPCSGGFCVFWATAVAAARRRAANTRDFMPAYRTYSRFSRGGKMKRTLTAVAVMLFALTARADQQSIYRIRGLLDDLGRLATDLAKEANRDAEILRRLVDA